MSKRLRLNESYVYELHNSNTRIYSLFPTILEIEKPICKSSKRFTNKSKLFLVSYVRKKKKIK